MKRLKAAMALRYNGEDLGVGVGFQSDESRAALRNKFTRGFLADRTFVVGVMGTSVTAGHDNYFNQSYPMVFESTMAQVLAAAGVRAEVRNNAIGGNRYEQVSPACVRLHPHRR